MAICDPAAKFVGAGPDFGHNLQNRSAIFLHSSNLAGRRQILLASAAHCGYYSNQKDRKRYQ